MKINIQNHFKIKLIFLTISLSLLFPLTSVAVMQISLEWQPNAESDLAGYRVFSRLSSENYNYAEPSWEGIQTSCVVDIPDEEQRYFFVVRAVTMSGSMSPDSEEVCYGCTICPDDPHKIYSGVCGCGVLDTDIDVDRIWDCFDTDDDNDSIEDTIEANGPNQGDGNLDGILDSQQCNVASIAVDENASYIILESPVNTCINNFKQVDDPSPDDIPIDIDFEFGFYEYGIRNIGLGTNLAVTIILPEGISPNTYYAYGMTPDNQTDHWYAFLDDGETGAEINDNIVTLYLGDALRGDNILTNDSMILGLGGPGFITADTDEPDPEVVSENNDNCPDDPDKVDPGGCGCGIADTDYDVDGVWDCYDTDDDNDGIEDTIEANGPNQGDSNLDGILDSLQCNVTSLTINENPSYIVIETSEESCITDFKRVDNLSLEDIPRDINFEFGLYEFGIRNVGLDTSVIVTITLPEGASPDTYYTYGITPDNQTDHWYELFDDGKIGVDINENIITLSLVDAMRGDSILNNDNIIKSLGGPGFFPAGAGNNSSLESEVIYNNNDINEADGGCFVGCLSP